MHISAECWYLNFRILDHKPTFYKQICLKPEESFLFEDDKDSGEGLQPHFTLNDHVLNPSLQPTEAEISELVTKHYVSHTPNRGTTP